MKQHPPRHRRRTLIVCIVSKTRSHIACVVQKWSLSATLYGNRYIGCRSVPASSTYSLSLPTTQGTRAVQHTSRSCSGTRLNAGPYDSQVLQNHTHGDHLWCSARRRFTAPHQPSGTVCSRNVAALLLLGSLNNF